MRLPKLFGHPDSGHAYKVRLCLSVADLAHDYEVVDIFSERNTRSTEFQRHARFGEVPVYVENGKAFLQSNAILLHLAQQTSRFGGENDDTLHACTQWLMWEANKIGMCLPQLRARKKMGADESLEKASPWLHTRFVHDINVLNEALSDGRSWMIGSDNPTIADFSLCGYLFFADEAELTVPANVQAWLERVASLKGWEHPYQLLG